MALKRDVGQVNGRTIILMDSISYIDVHDRNQIVISGSHGGLAAGRYALAHPPFLVVFNDAGGGKDDAGILALRLLADVGVAAAAVSHTSARIGEADETWLWGVVSHINAAAAALGIGVGMAVKTAVLSL